MKTTTLTKNEVEMIVKDQDVRTGRGFYIIPVFKERNSTTINGQQFWGLSFADKPVYAKNAKRFFFFRGMTDVKEVNTITEI